MKTRKMLNEKEISEIREHLEKAQSPVFFFDNDNDGLCSFLLLRRFLGRGKGVAIKSYPDMDVGYFKRAEELDADYIFILDKPVISKEFWDEAERRNVPIVWLDHHKPSEANFRSKTPGIVSAYNPAERDEKLSEVPTSYLCHQITKSRGGEDLWLAVIGCISDHYTPDFYPVFSKKYKDLIPSDGDERPFGIYYNSEIGRIAKMMAFGLKDTTTNVVNMMRFLVHAKSPYEVISEDAKNYTMRKKFEEVQKRYMKFFEKAMRGFERNPEGKILFFSYGGDTSMSAELSNELSFRHPDKVVVIAYKMEIKANISIRGEKIREAVVKVVQEFEDATGGGHENAVGAQVRVGDLEKFVKRLREEFD